MQMLARLLMDERLLLHPLLLVFECPGTALVSTKPHGSGCTMSTFTWSLHLCLLLLQAGQRQAAAAAAALTAGG
jgi:hypothetical protein